MPRARSTTPVDAPPCPGPWGWLVAAALLGLYLVTLCPTIYSGDAAELAAAGATLGIPHPPGYPLYTLLAHLATLLIPVGEVAYRVNLLSALCAAGAALLLHRLLVELTRAPAAAAAAALGLGVGLTFWSQALISEVYALDMLLACATLCAAAAAGRRGDLRSACLAALCAGLWLGHRNVNLLYLPAALLLAGRAPWAHLRRPRSAAAVLSCLALPPLLLLLYLPLASMRDPVIDTLDPETWDRLVELLQARTYRRYLLSGDLAANLGHILSGLPRELGLGMALAPLGLALGWKRQRRAAAALALLAAANLAFAGSYGVIDVTVFTLPGLLALWTLAGLGLAAVARRPGALARAGALLLGLGCCAPLLATNFGENNLRGQTLTRDFARDALAFPRRKGLVLTHVDSVTFSLWYAQLVEQRRGDLLLASRGRAAGWYQRQVKAQRPDLDIPIHGDQDAATLWPALLVMRNAHKVPVYLTADLRGYFPPQVAARIAQDFAEQPAGLLTRLVPRAKAAAEVALSIRRNQAFWRKAWPHVTAARAQRLGTDMAALLLHYGSMRLLFARYCLQHDDPAAAERAAAAVAALKPGPIIARVNAVFARQQSRYHMSDMPEQARRLVALAHKVRRGESPAPTAPPTPAPAPPPGPTPEDPIDALNMQGVTLAQRGDLKGALANFDRVLKQQPRHLGALFNRAKVLGMARRTTDAAAAYRELLGLAPKHLPALLSLAELVQQQAPAEALQLLQRAAAAPGMPQLQQLARQRLAALQQILAR